MKKRKEETHGSTIEFASRGAKRNNRSGSNTLAGLPTLWRDTAVVSDSEIELEIRHNKSMGKPGEAVERDPAIPIIL